MCDELASSSGKISCLPTWTTRLRTRRSKPISKPKRPINWADFQASMYRSSIVATVSGTQAANAWNATRALAHHWFAEQLPPCGAEYHLGRAYVPSTAHRWRHAVSRARWRHALLLASAPIAIASELRRADVKFTRSAGVFRTFRMPSGGPDYKGSNVATSPLWKQRVPRDTARDGLLRRSRPLLGQFFGR